MLPRADSPTRSPPKGAAFASRISVPWNAPRGGWPGPGAVALATLRCACCATSREAPEAGALVRCGALFLTPSKLQSSHPVKAVHAVLLLYKLLCCCCGPTSALPPVRVMSVHFRDERHSAPAPARTSHLPQHHHMTCITSAAYIDAPYAEAWPWAGGTACSAQTPTRGERILN